MFIFVAMTTVILHVVSLEPCFVCKRWCLSLLGFSYFNEAARWISWKLWFSGRKTNFNFRQHKFSTNTFSAVSTCFAQIPLKSLIDYNITNQIRKGNESATVLTVDLMMSQLQLLQICLFSHFLKREIQKILNRPNNDLKNNVKIDTWSFNRKSTIDSRPHRSDVLDQIK